MGHLSKDLLYDEEKAKVVVNFIAQTLNKNAINRRSMVGVAQYDNLREKEIFI